MFLSCVEAPPAVNTTVARHSAQPNQYSHTPYGQANSSGDTPLTSPRLIHEFTSCLPYHPCRPFHPCLLLVASWVLPWESRWRHTRLSSAVMQHLMRPPALCGPPDQQQQNIHGVINSKCLQTNSWRVTEAMSTVRNLLPHAMFGTGLCNHHMCFHSPTRNCNNLQRT